MRRARSAGVSFRGLQLLEQPGHDWRISTMSRVVSALGLPGEGIELLVQRYLRMPVDSMAAVSIRMVCDGFDSWKKHLFDYVDAMRRSLDPELFAESPAAFLDPRRCGLCACTTEALCAELGLETPAWCRGVPPLDRPWFVAGMENLKASALVESPAWFRARRIFVLRNFLSRA